jgi:hypothetical protein
MRIVALALVGLACACAAPGAGTHTSLIAADAATALIAGERLEMVRTVAGGGQAGGDPLVQLQLRHADGREMAFEEANHAPNDLRAQSPGGPLAQIMGLFGEEAPTLYAANGSTGAPFLCGPDGPVAIGMHQAPDGVVMVAGLKQAIEFEARPDGTEEALPYSPDMVCARLRFRRG